MSGRKCQIAELKSGSAGSQQDTAPAAVASNSAVALFEASTLQAVAHANATAAAARLYVGS